MTKQVKFGKTTKTKGRFCAEYQYAKIMIDKNNIRM